MNKCGARIRAARRARRVSQQELAAGLRISDRQMRYIEAGKSPITDVRLEKIARLLDMPASALLEALGTAFPPRHEGAPPQASSGAQDTVDAVIRPKGTEGRGR